MKILLAADGSEYTKKAAAFLVTHERLAGPDDELIVLHVQSAVPPRVTAMLGASAVRSYHSDEAAKVLGPISVGASRTATGGYTLALLSLVVVALASSFALVAAHRAPGRHDVQLSRPRG